MTWPRPPNDNGVGIHFGSPTLPNIEKYLPTLIDMRAKWVVLADESPDLIGKVAPILIDNGIMPIARPQTYLDSRPNWANKARWCKSPYVQIYNEPGDTREWEHKRPSEWWGIFVEKWIGAAHKVRSVGCYPGLQVTSTDELRWMLQDMSARYETDLWSDMWLSLHLYPSEGCAPIATCHEDDMLAFLKYAEVCEEIMGFVPPMIITETAWTPSQASPETRAKWMVEVFEWFKGGEYHYYIEGWGRSEGQPLPDYLFAVCPWILFGRWLWFGLSWTDNIDNVSVLEAVKAMEPFTRVGAKNSSKKL